MEIRNTKYYICGMENEKRLSRSYKATNTDYKAAMKRAKKEKKKLAVIVEEVIAAYGDGAFTLLFTKTGSQNLEKGKRKSLWDIVSLGVD